MERTYLQPGAVIAPKNEPEELFRVLKVYEHCGRLWVDVIKARYCLPLDLHDVQKNYTLVALPAAETED